jgi:uncharacterized membrane protein YhfC
MVDYAVVISFGVAVLLELFFPLVVGAWLVRKYRLSWRVFGYGVFFFVIVQIPHTPLVLLIQAPAFTALSSAFPDRTVALAVFSIVLGLLAGLFEESGRFLVFRYFFSRKGVPLSRENGLLFGAGWGGIESMIIGILLLLTMFSYIIAAPLTDETIQHINRSAGGTLTAEQIAQIKAQNEALLDLTPIDPLIGLAERLMTFPVHIALSLLVLAAVVQKRTLLLVLAIVWHTILDALAVFLAQTAGIIAAETVVAVSMALSLAYIWWSGRSGPFPHAPERS